MSAMQDAFVSVKKFSAKLSENNQPVNKNLRRHQIQKIDSYRETRTEMSTYIDRIAATKSPYAGSSNSCRTKKNSGLKFRRMQGNTVYHNKLHKSSAR